MSDNCSQNYEGLPVDSDKTFCFKWGNYHHYLSEVVKQLLQEESMVDVTLFAEGERIYAHKIVLSACSSLFQTILSQVNDEHPTIILSDISAHDIKSIVEFCYNGEIGVPVENINNLIDSAHSLQIHGLMQIEGWDSDLVNDIESTIEADFNNESEVEQNVDNQISENLNEELDELNMKRKKVFPKKYYNEETLSNAIEDLKSGQTLQEASKKHLIPRSTLYMRAKAQGVIMAPQRNEYSPECMKAAIDSVIAGASLQHAGDTYGIPKTVLWRRIQKEGHQVFRNDSRKAYDSEKRLAAIKALSRGENLTKVSQEYQIPKTTLFRDKVRLIDEGKLPESFWKKRKSEGEDEKKSRLEEAVAACRDGKMSQAMASVVFEIPKTTIWRRIQTENKKLGIVPSKKPRLSKSDEMNIKTEFIESDFDQYYDPLEIPITYVDEESLPENSVIILTSDEIEGFDLENTRTITVSENFMTGDLELDEEAIYTTTKNEL